VFAATSLLSAFPGGRGCTKLGGRVWRMYRPSAVPSAANRQMHGSQIRAGLAPETAFAAQVAYGMTDGFNRQHSMSDRVVPITGLQLLKWARVQPLCAYPTQRTAKRLVNVSCNDRLAEQVTGAHGYSPNRRTAVKESRWNPKSINP
jgi:hypothetical protein